MQLASVGDAESAGIAVHSGALMRVFPVTQGERLAEAQAQRGGKIIGRAALEMAITHGGLFEGRGDGSVVGRSSSEGLLRQTPAGGERKIAAHALHFLGDGGVIGRRGDDGNILEILGGRAHHRGPANIDVLDQLVGIDIGSSGGFLEGIKVHHHHVDGLNFVLGDLAKVF